jgi:hypothetical protein
MQTPLTEAVSLKNINNLFTSHLCGDIHLFPIPPHSPGEYQCSQMALHKNRIFGLLNGTKDIISTFRILMFEISA